MKTVDTMTKILRRWLLPVREVVSRGTDAVVESRLTDEGLLVVSVLSAMVVGLAIAVFHLGLTYAESWFHWLGTSVDLGLTVLTVPLLAALGGLTVGVLKRTMFRDLVAHEGLETVVHLADDQGHAPGFLHGLRALLLSTISIATGGGAGREAPTIILGASMASTVGRLVVLRPSQIRIIGAAGAAAAISGIFNAPLGGIVFAIEIISGDIKSKTFIPVVISSVVSTSVVRLLLGNHILLRTPAFLDALSMVDLGLLAIAGVLSAFVALYYLRTYRITHVFIRSSFQSLPFILRPMFGGLLAGIPLIFLPALLETSYEPINNAIAGIGVLWISIATIVLKPVTNAITLASGGEGGTFAPSLKVGALFGYCLGMAAEYVVPGVPPGMFALVCAGAVVSGTFSAPLTGAIVIFEISGNTSLLVPLLLSSVVCHFVVRRFALQTFNPRSTGVTSSPPVIAQ